MPTTTRLLLFASLALLFICDRPAPARTRERAAPTAPPPIRYVGLGASAAGALPHRTRDFFFHQSEGSEIVPYALFKRFASNNRLAQYGLLEDGSDLPIGLARMRPRSAAPLSQYQAHAQEQEHDRDWVGMNCAACHVGEIEHNGVRTRIVGAPSQFDVEWFLRDLIRMVLDDFRPGEAAPERDREGRSPAVNDPRSACFPAKAEWHPPMLLTEHRDDPLAVVRALSMERIERFNRGTGCTAGDTIPGPGRVDAFGSVRNIVFTDLHQAKTAPVSYPHLWDYRRLVWLHWDASSDSPMDRFIGQAIGVGAMVLGRSPEHPFASTVRPGDIHALTQITSRLVPPRWEDVFPDQPLDKSKLLAGRALFKEICAGCHPVIATRQEPAVCPAGAEWELRALDSSVIVRDEDSYGYQCVNRSRPDLHCEDALCPGRTNDQRCRNAPGAQEVRIKTDPRRLEMFCDPHFLPRLDEMLRCAKGHAYKDLQMTKAEVCRVDRFACSGGEPAVDTDGCTAAGPASHWRQTQAYVARPLTAIWATAPYLHNNSVPTLYDLLKPQGERPRRFVIGRRVYDPKHLGFFHEEKPGVIIPWEFVMDTAKDGNSNQGHEFGAALSDGQRMTLLEYLKSL